jgi:hypothetical protein
MCDKYGWTELKELNEKRAESMAKTEAFRTSVLADYIHDEEVA